MGRCCRLALGFLSRRLTKKRAAGHEVRLVLVLLQEVSVHGLKEQTVRRALEPAMSAPRQTLTNPEASEAGEARVEGVAVAADQLLNELLLLGGNLRRGLMHLPPPDPGSPLQNLLLRHDHYTETRTDVINRKDAAIKKKLFY